MREKEIAKLIEKGERNLKIAKEHYEKTEYDFSVSEGYFSMFYLTEALLLTKNLGFSKHSAVISAFG